MTVCRLLPYAVADGAHNMAADEALLESAAAGDASLRFYGWSEPTLSLGYFQAERLRHEDARLAILPYVRRPSGGDTLVHDHEVTYALALPAGPPWQNGEPWLCRVHHIIAAGLVDLGIGVRPVDCGDEKRLGPVLCFQHWTAGDLVVGTAKVVGSAQRRQRGALLQHGAVLLEGSQHAPALPGIAELCGRRVTVAAVRVAVGREFARQTGWDLVSGDWTNVERQRITALVATKYSRPSWNAKR
jgi:lipoate-protein ligase A